MKQFVEVHWEMLRLNCVETRVNTKILKSIKQYWLVDDLSAARKNMLLNQVLRPKFKDASRQLSLTRGFKEVLT